MFLRKPFCGSESFLLVLVFSVILWQPQQVSADFGDLEDLSFQCPAFTTCPAICANLLSECPTTCDPGLELCSDGHCADDCSARPPHEIYPNPCQAYTCTPIACPKVDDTTEACHERFGAYYLEQEETQETCLEGAAGKGDKSGVRLGFYRFLAVWLILNSLAIVAWCRHNRKTSPLLSTQPLEGDTNNSNSRGQEQYVPVEQTQTGYKPHFLGTLLYYWTLLTIWGFQLVLASLVILYYTETGSITAIQQTIYENEQQILRTFEIVWCVGFVWNLTLKWPVKLRALFWKRCLLPEATHVLVWTPKNQQQQTHGVIRSQRYVMMLRKLVGRFTTALDRCLAVVFAQDPEARTGRHTFCTVHAHEGYTSKYFVHNFRRYIMVLDGENNDSYKAGKVADEESKATIGKWIQHSKRGLVQDQVKERLEVVGPNSLSMPEPSYFRIIKEEFTQMYYTYQNFIMWSWMPLSYYYMAITQSLVILTAGLTVCVFRYRNEASLFQLTFMEGDMEVLRDNQYETVSQADLVPGDVVVVDTGITYCDMVLINGSGILVDESALTGEATPVAKTAIDPAEENDTYSMSRHKRHTIQAGTSVLESEHRHNLAIVTHTGSYTTKGELLRDIFAYERHQFKFDVEVGCVLLILFLYAIFCFFLTFALLQYTAVYGWFYGMFAVASVIPPLLPTVFTVSVGVSTDRLAKKRVACTNSEEILVAGKVKRAFFDKTGTLTRQGLEFICARSAEDWEQPDKTSANMSLCMAVCHSLTQTSSGTVIGNPVDQTMFASSGASFQGSPGASSIVDSRGVSATVLKHYDFDHHRMTQSVIVKTNGKLVAFVKGSGESISALCSSRSLPQNYSQGLRSSAKAGIYQISMAMKVLSPEMESSVATIPRDSIERDLDFIGSVDFKNLLREETPSVIRELEEGEVKCIMVTGDSTLTGIRIAKESGIIYENKDVYFGASVDERGDVVWHDHDDNVVSLPADLAASNIDLAVTGDVWASLKQNSPEIASKLSEFIRVYGRCTPLHKISVVNHFIDEGYITMMTGDGGNDAGALKTAHVGVALSDAEASIVSPFTSLDKSITSVVDVLREGRCALASAVASYKFMIMYGQLTAAVNIINAWFAITFPEFGWVFTDGVWTICLSFSLALSKPAEKLANTRPTSSLLSVHTLASAIGVLFIHFFFTVMSFVILFAQDWFQCRQWENEDVSNVLVIGDNYETTTVFLVMGYQLIASAIVFNIGYEWRAGWFSNRWLVLMIIVFTTLHFWITLVPGKISCIFRINCSNENVVPSVTSWTKFPIQNELNTTVMPIGYRFTLLVMMILNTVCVILWDYFAVNGTRKRIGNKRRANASSTLVLKENEVTDKDVV